MAISAFAPSYDPLDGNHAHYTLDLSHTATAGTDALDMAARMGSGLAHLHLCDGNGASTDEHLVPGRGTQPTVEVCQMLAGSDFTGHVVLEVTTSWRAPRPNATDCSPSRWSSPGPICSADPEGLPMIPPPRFSDAMILRPVDGPAPEAGSAFAGHLSEDWAIGPKVHGG